MIGQAAATNAWTGWRAAVWAAAIGLLILPAIAMRVSAEVDWDATDFLAAALLLGGGALVFDRVSRRAPSGRALAVRGAMIAAALLIAWAMLAVGPLGD